MANQNQPTSLQSYAYQLRKLLIQQIPLDRAFDLQREKELMVRRLNRELKGKVLPYADRFALKFIRKANLLQREVIQDVPGYQISSLMFQVDKRPAKRRNGAIAGKGAFQDLNLLVKEVRTIWFPWMENDPKVTWLKRFTTRKLAHYAMSRDEVAVSLIFDFEDVPAEILSYLLYHELLHRVVGVERKNGRQYAHTSEFKALERRYPGWESIDSKINQYIMYGASD